MRKEDIVNIILKSIQGKNYLEIGVATGRSFIPIKAKRKIAVDPVFKKPLTIKFLSFFFAKKNFYFQMTSDDFFKHKSQILNRHGIDVSLIDGLHTYEQSLKDCNNCLNYLTKNGVIIVHDCNPTTKTMAYPAKSGEEARSLNLPDWRDEWCGDVWKTIVHLRSTRHDLEVAVLDCDFGVGIVRRGKPESVLTYTRKQIKTMTYSDLESNRKTFLNLKNPAIYLKDFI